MDKNRDSYNCASPECGSKIHEKCDKTLKEEKPEKNQLCPRCRDLTLVQKNKEEEFSDYSLIPTLI